jgi:alpha-1,2-mannosyltransferase
MRDLSLLPKRQLRLPSLFWALIAIIVFMLSSAWIAWRLYASPYDDLPTFYWATRLAFDQGFSAYQSAHFLELGQSLDRKIYPFLYPPSSLLLFSPVLFCADYEQCKTVFSILNLLWWWVLVWAFYGFYLRCIGTAHKPMGMGFLLLFFTLAYMPITDTLKNGQINLIVLLCLMPTLFAPTGRHQQVLAGLLLACAIVLKVYVLLLIPVMLIFGRWREVMVTLAILGMLVVMSVVLLPVSMWQEWFELGMGMGYGKGIPQVLTIPFNQSINGFFIRYFLEQRGAGQPTDWILWIYGTVLLCVFLAGYSILKHLRRWQQGYSVALALVLLLINLIAPLTWLHHYVFTLPAIILAVAFLQHAPPTRSKKLTVILLILALGCLSAPYLSAWAFADKVLLPEAGRGMGLSYNLVLSTPLVAALVIFILFLRLIAKRG